MQAARVSPIPLFSWVAAVGLAAVAGCAVGQKEGVSMTLGQTKQGVLGEWVSVAPEVRPSATKNPDGTLKPFYLTRNFKALADDRFELTIVNTAHPYAKLPVARIYLRGHMLWKGEHPIASGAQKVDFVADEAYEITPLAQGFADILNRVAADGYANWEVNVTQSVFGKSFVPSRLDRRSQLHGVRPGLPPWRLAVLGRTECRWPGLRHRSQPPHQPADPDAPKVARRTTLDADRPATARTSRAPCPWRRSLPS